MIKTGISRPIYLFVLAWTVIALLMLLTPSPREWGSLGHWLSPIYDRISGFFEPAVHISLMAAMAMVCMHHFHRMNIMPAVFLSFGTVMLAAGFFEGLQSLLPREFARRCDVADLVPAAIGATVGCLAGLIARALKCKRNDRCKKSHEGELS